MILFKEELKELMKAPSKEKKSKKKSRLKFKKAPKVKPISYTKGALLFIGLSWFGMLLSAAIATYVFFGIATLAGLIAISENSTYIRHCIIKSNRLIDILIFLLTIYSTLTLGVTITASLTIAGLGYSLVYAPWLRSRFK
ncbi:hypothetical protein [Seonamhaeicola aphaedonensis]|uniref:Uncharacterized protein n=1 Tax=Seonamhaeicola aphaedonensis TaxID=1461338 RepID=A0A3D9HHU4_9FLAO|nr:hypothetical protein [Seonamhaeicola aphaedonensis]RED48821.1 hypothetical protein DFQ02_103151 [Seonamhaeicola aphaedonensis]